MHTDLAAMTEGGFKFNFKVGEQPAVEEEASDEFLSGQEDEFPEDEQGDVVDDFSWHKPEDPTIWPPCESGPGGRPQHTHARLGGSRVRPWRDDQPSFPAVPEHA